MCKCNGAAALIVSPCKIVDSVPSDCTKRGYLCGREMLPGEVNRGLLLCKRLTEGYLKDA
jgi:hypothetical protein